MDAMPAEPTSKCTRELLARIAREPSGHLHLLLRVEEAGQVQHAAIESAGFVVRHMTTLVPCFAVSGPGISLNALLDEPWLVRVEEDSPIEAL